MGVSESRIGSHCADPVQQAREILSQQEYFVHLDELRRCLKGKVLLPGEADYEGARRRPFNHDARGYPAVIVQVASSEDVIAAMRFYFALGKPVSDSLSNCVPFKFKAKIRVVFAWPEELTALAA